MMVWVAGFDIGIRNFAFTVIQWKGRDHRPDFEVVDLQNIDITITKEIGKDVARDILEVMRAYKTLWDQCDYFIIEQQMQFRHATNIKALKISQFVLCYLCMHYSDREKTIVEYPAYFKTQILGAPPGMKKYDRKKWVVETIRRILREREQEHFLQGFSKKADDVSDAIALVLAYIRQNGL